MARTTTMRLLLILASAAAAAAQSRYYFIKPCRYDQPEAELNECLRESANFFTANCRRGIPELGITDIEPVVIDEIGIALGSGPDGYRATFRNIQAYGVSNLTVSGFRSNLKNLEMQMTFNIPHISAKAKYQSSGILLLIRASGGGDYWGEYGGVRAKVYLKASPQKVGKWTFLKLQQLKMDFTVKEIRMGVENVHNGNSVLQAALNLFINSNSQDLLKEMKPDLKKKLISTMVNFVKKLFGQIPLEAWLV